MSATGAEYARGIRRILLALFFLGAVGLVAELFLLEHTESAWQWVPFVTLTVGMVGAGLMVLRPTATTVRCFQVAMALVAVAGLLGIALHLWGNAAFELESEPSVRGRELLWRSLGGATPALAPGAMLQLGLLGLAATYRHPALRRIASGLTHNHSKEIR